MSAPYILDVDTGIDDSLALALAVNSPEVELLAVTTLAGNVDVARTTDNTQRVLAWLGAGAIAVHRGASRPLARAHRDAAHVHGTNGLGNAELPATEAAVGRDRGPAAMIRLANARPGEITLVCVGPLTNLAIALNVEPGLTELVNRVVIMGGAFFNPGNITPHAEFNIFVDPEAAEQVFAAPFAEMTIVGLDASHQTALTRAEWAGADGAMFPAAALLHRVYASTYLDRGLEMGYLHDPLALAIAIDPTLADYATGRATVVLDGAQRGKTALAPGEGTTRVATGIDRERFGAMFAERMGLS